MAPWPARHGALVALARAIPCQRVHFAGLFWGDLTGSKGVSVVCACMFVCVQGKAGERFGNTPLFSARM